MCGRGRACYLICVNVPLLQTEGLLYMRPDNYCCLHVLSSHHHLHAASQDYVPAKYVQMQSAAAMQTPVIRPGTDAHRKQSRCV